MCNLIIGFFILLKSSLSIEDKKLRFTEICISSVETSISIEKPNRNQRGL